ncbi:NAD-dependent epimerase/dehydratase family protein [Bifidobacterium cuniculi]|uniref:Nucleoside-diphosphate-sugar epimerase n=1 Tax=Bifidobacterium cuniculi TaxID=1688 RepID=A0A087B2P7_9BIFI|nr:NAD-dependent epimerase/dehydratase family protein [Bifidobacterium cuniculi]KFI65297.1 Nucleoside-diphosphate-sugar epimerase [Bifidobacterium cuniculi]
MARILITGGTVFVSKALAEHFVRGGDDVTVVNRGSRPQVDGVRLVQCDRGELGDRLAGQSFDLVVDVNAYDRQDVVQLTDALAHTHVGTIVLISSSAVYPETNLQPFAEGVRLGENTVWGAYGLGKIEAERALLERAPHAYIVRPPYLYGPGNNVYREAFVFDCARRDRVFRLPGDGSMRLQFFHIRDLCQFVERIAQQQPEQHIFNVGNPQTVSVRDWVEMCYRAAGRDAAPCTSVTGVPQRLFFPFHDYGYELDVRGQQQVLPTTIPLEAGLHEAYDWYCAHGDEVTAKPYMEYIDRELA